MVERLSELEGRVERLEAQLAGLTTERRRPETLPPPPPPTIDQRVPVPAPSATAPRRTGLVWETETVLRWVGIGLVVLAVGFAVSTAISRGWIGPELQLLGALAFAGALIGVGLRLQPVRPAWTHALCTGGVLALFTTFASDLFIDQISTAAAYGLTVVTAAFGVALAVFVSSQWVAAAATVGSMIGWAVIGEADPPVAASAGLLAFGITIIVALAEWRRWYAVRLTAHAALMASSLLLAAAATSTADQVAVLMAALLAAVSLSWLPSSGGLESGFQQIEVQLATLVGAYVVGIIGLSFEMDGDTTLGLIGLATGAGLAGAAMGLRPRLLVVHFVSLVIGAGIAVSIGFAFLLSTSAALVAIAVQGAGLLVLSRMLDREVRVLVNASVLLAISGSQVAERTVDAWRVDAAAGDDVAHLLIIAALGAAALLLWVELFRKVGAALVLALSLAWLGSVLVHLPQGQALVSVSWAVVGVGVLATGAIGKLTDVAAAGLVVLALTVGKLLTVDLTEVDTLWRAALFFVVGLGLMRLGFMLPDLTGRGWHGRSGGPASTGHG